MGIVGSGALRHGLASASDGRDSSEAQDLKNLVMQLVAPRLVYYAANGLDDERRIIVVDEVSGVFDYYALASVRQPYQVILHLMPELSFPPSLTHDDQGATAVLPGPVLGLFQAI